MVYALADRNREHLREWFAWVDATKSEDDILAFIRRSLNQFASNSGFSAGIWEQGAYAGNISLHKVDWLNRRAEIGYWLGREFQGRGIVTDACRAVTRHALVELELNRVEIRCATANAKSKAIPVRLGVYAGRRPAPSGVAARAIRGPGSLLDVAKRVRVKVGRTSRSAAGLLAGLPHAT